MQLFSSGAFYMHDSPCLAAEFLTDADTIRMSNDSGILLSTVIQYQVCAIDTRLWQPDRELTTSIPEVFSWLGASQHNVAWMLDYFIALHNKRVRLFRDKSVILTFKYAVQSYLGCFDDCDAAVDWLPLRPYDARTAYRASIKKYQYRKVRIPYWLDTSVRESSDSETVGSDAFDLLTFDLDSF